MLVDNALKYVRNRMCDLVDNRCYAMTQPITDADAFPAIVYYLVGTDYTSTFSGLGQGAQRIRIDVRGREYGEVTDLVDKIMERIKDRLVQVYNVTDAFDDELKIYRKIISVGISPYG